MEKNNVEVFMEINKAELKLKWHYACEWNVSASKMS